MDRIGSIEHSTGRKDMNEETTNVEYVPFREALTRPCGTSRTRSATDARCYVGGYCFVQVQPPEVWKNSPALTVTDPGPCASPLEMIDWSSPESSLVRCQ